MKYGQRELYYYKIITFLKCEMWGMEDQKKEPEEKHQL